MDSSPGPSHMESLPIPSGYASMCVEYLAAQVEHWHWRAAARRLAHAVYANRGVHTQCSSLAISTSSRSSSYLDSFSFQTRSLIQCIQ